MEISSDIWGEILQFASREPRYKGISKSIDLHMKYKNIDDYLNTEYKGYDDIKICRFQYNRAALRKEWQILRLMITKSYNKTQNINSILFGIMILHIFRQEDMVIKLIQEHKDIKLHLYSLYNPEFSMKFGFLICTYYLKFGIPKDMVNDILKRIWTKNVNNRSTVDTIGYMDDRLFSEQTLLPILHTMGHISYEIHITGFQTSIPMMVRMPTIHDRISYMVKDKESRDKIEVLTDQEIFQVLSSAEVVTPVVLNYMNNLFKKRKTTNGSIDVTKIINSINWNIVKVFKDKTNVHQLYDKIPKLRMFMELK